VLVPWVLIGALGFIAVVLLIAFSIDRRAHKRGHTPRTGWSSNRALRERRRDQKVQADGAYRDTSWVDHSQGGQLSNDPDER
jgi:hypothetical protein